MTWQNKNSNPRIPKEQPATLIRYEIDSSALSLLPACTWFRTSEGVTWYKEAQRLIDGLGRCMVQGLNEKDALFNQLDLCAEHFHQCQDEPTKNEFIAWLKQLRRQCRAWLTRYASAQ